MSGRRASRLSSARTHLVASAHPGPAALSSVTVTCSPIGMRGSIVCYSAGGSTFHGYRVMPACGLPRPGVLVAHEGPGLGAHARHRTEQLAGLGYVALAIDLHGDGHVAASHEETIALVTGLRDRRDVLRARVQAGLDALLATDGVDRARIAAVGYCFGGLAVLELARSGAAVAGTVTFHGLLESVDPRDARGIVGKVLVLTGAADHLVPREQVTAFEREMSDADVDCQIVSYVGVRHAFTNMIEADALAKLGFGYNADADRRSWTAMRSFLDEVFA